MLLALAVKIRRHRRIACAFAKIANGRHTYHAAYEMLAIHREKHIKPAPKCTHNDTIMSL